MSTIIGQSSTGPSATISTQSPDLPWPYNVSQSEINIILNKSNYLQESEKDRKISITLPFSLWRSRFNIITKFTIVISRTMITENSSYTKVQFISKNYKQCQQRYKCVYEILYPDNQNGNYTFFNFTDTLYVIGEDVGCEEKGHRCNGPLTPDKKYRISLRVYSKDGYVTLGDLEKQTQLNYAVAFVMGLVFALTFVELVCVICIIFVKFGSRFNINEQNQIDAERHNGFNNYEQNQIDVTRRNGNDISLYQTEKNEYDVLEPERNEYVSFEMLASEKISQNK